MKIINRLLILFLSLSPMVIAQLPFFLQRFRPVKHSLLSSGSSSYPSFASSLFPLSSSSSLLSPTYGSANHFLSGSSHSSSPFSSSGLGSFSLSSPFAASASSLSPQQLIAASNLGSLFGSSSYASPSFASSHFSGSPSFGSASSHFGGSPSFTLSHLGGSQQHFASAASHLSGSPSFASSHLLGSPSFGSSHLKFSPSSLSQPLVDLGSSGSGYEGVSGYDQAELLDDYPGFSNVGFAKDLNFAGSRTVQVQSPAPYNAELVYLQRSNEQRSNEKK